MRKRPKHFIFIQSWGTFSNDTLVVAGASAKEVIAYVKKNKCKKDFVKWVEESAPVCEKHVTGTSSGCSSFNDGWSILWLRPFDDNWVYWETLIHELSHLIDHILGTMRGVALPETECRAYQFEYLFRSIRRKLQGVEPKV